jgi:hypothetical protein
MIKVCGRDIRLDGRLVRLASLDGEKYTFPDEPDAMLDGLRKCGKRVDLFTFLQKLPETSPKYPYHAESDNLAVLPISTFDHWWTKQIDVKTRNMVRKAEKKGVTIREVSFGETLINGIVRIYNETPIRQGKRFPHYGMSVKQAGEYAGTFLNRSIFAGAFLDEAMIGFIKFVTDESRTQACILHILSMVQHRDKAATNALIAQAVRSCSERGISFLVYENFSYGKKQQDSLSDFKHNNGFQRIDLPRYYIPLTRIGSVGLRLGLHRSLLDRIPEPLLARLRSLRNAWYTRKGHPKSEA